jgi:integrase
MTGNANESGGNREHNRALCEPLRENPPDGASVASPFAENGACGPHDRAPSLVSEGCRRCGAPLSSGVGRCARCGSFGPGPGNAFALRHGGRSRHVVENEAALVLQAEKCAALRGHLGRVSVVQEDLIGDYARLDLLIDTVADNIGRLGVLTAKGRTRATVNLLLQLLGHANPHLRALIVAALSTGCRIGELLSLQWQQIRYDERKQARWIVLPAAKTKTNTARVLPIGPRLGAELAMRQQGPDGKDHPPTAYVFGDETGDRVGSVKRAWELTVLRAHGHTPIWVAGKPGRLAPESRAALREINLHFHDLRRQFACTLLESSADLHDVRDFLGHANITTTSRYLASSPVRLARALARLEGEEAKDGPVRTRFAHTAAESDESEPAPHRNPLN